MTTVDKIMTIPEAADHAHVTRQAIYVAIVKKKLKAEKKGRNWLVSLKDLEDYRINRYNRDLRKFEGQTIYDLEKGFYSVSQLTVILSSTLKRPFNMQKVYYLIRTGELPAHKKGYAWVINKKDALELVEREENIKELVHRNFG